MDYYSTLGINKNASQEEIKTAYRKMAMKHHPDRGGNEKTFKNITEAYETLKDPQKKQMYDTYGTADPRQRQYNSQNFEFEFGDDPFGMGDLFRNFGFGMGARRGNQNISIAVDISLEDVLTGKTVGIELQLETGRTKVVTIDIPSGIEHNQQIRYGGMGDDSHRQFRPGDLIIQVRVRNHGRFTRHGDNILCEKEIPLWDLLLGTYANIVTLDGKHLEIAIPKGTQVDTVLSCKGEGLPNIKTKRRGNLLIKIKTKIPKDLTNAQLNTIRELKNGI